MLKIPLRVTLAPKALPPLVRQRASIGTYHILAQVALLMVIFVLEDYSPGRFRPFEKPADFAQLILCVHAAAVCGWIIAVKARCFQISKSVLRGGGCACIHCGYEIDPRVAETECPECGNHYSKDAAVEAWSAMWPGERGRRSRSR